jgi:hypothetical protein
MAQIINKINTLIWTADGVCREGSVGFSRDGVITELESRKTITHLEASNMYYTVQQEVIFERGLTRTVPLKTPLRVSIQPEAFIERPYAKENEVVTEDVFPPSSRGFYGRLSKGEKDALYVVQKIENDERSWLTIVDLDKGGILESHAIYPYESIAVTKLLDSEALSHVFIGNELESDEVARAKILEILDGPPPTWAQLYKLTRKVDVPGLQIKKNLRDTLSQLIPSTFPSEIREELMAFLAMIIDGKIPKEDPVDFFYNLLPTGILRALLIGHFQCIIDGLSEPNYVKLMAQADKGLLDMPRGSVAQSTGRMQWNSLRMAMSDSFPNWTGTVVDIVRALNKTNNIVYGLPISKAAARKSMQAWRQRLALMQYGLLIRLLIRPRVLGLHQVIYIGSAYRWPHRHMSWAANFGRYGEYPPSPQMQIMLMPSRSAEQVKRIIPGVISVSWSARASNYHLYIDERQEWESSILDVISSVENEMSPSKIQRRYGMRSKFGAHKLSSEEARIIDAVSSSPYLANLERKRYFEYFGFTKTKLRSVLQSLKDRGVLDIIYEFSETDLVSTLTLASGPPERICSLAESSLMNMPTSLVMMGENSQTCAILSRLPRNAVYDFASSLPIVGKDNKMEIRVLRPLSFSTYYHDFYQRLLRTDGTWDDDVSAFLSQARSKRRELSESSA